MIKRIVPVLAVLGAFVGAPQVARADSTVLTQAFCTATAFHICMDFGLDQIGDASSMDYQLTMKYASSNAAAGEEGWAGSLGLYDLDGGNSWTFTDLALVSQPAGQDWEIGNCSGLSGGGAQPSEFEACARETPAPPKGLGVGEWVTISFTSDALLTASDFTDAGGLGLRTHVQGLGAKGCSLKPDAREPGNVVGGIDAGDRTCGYPPPSTIPEPISMTLLATGLVGIGAVRRRRRGQKTAENDVTA